MGKKFRTKSITAYTESKNHLGTIHGSKKLYSTFSETLISQLHVMYKYGIFVRHRGKQGFIDPGPIHQVQTSSW